MYKARYKSVLVATPDWCAALNCQVTKHVKALRNALKPAPYPKPTSRLISAKRENRFLKSMLTERKRSVRFYTLITSCNTDCSE